MAVSMHQPIKANSNTIVCVSSPLKTVKKTINGKEVHVRTQANRTFGLLCLVDSNGKTLDPRTLGLKPGDEIPEFEFSDSPVLSRGGKDADGNPIPAGEETGLFWVEAV